MTPTLVTTLTAGTLGLVFAATAAAQTLPIVRLTTGEGAIYARRSTRDAPTTVLPAGTLLEAVDKVDGWYWVVLPSDAFGTRPAGWVQVGDAEQVTKPRVGTATWALTGGSLVVETAVKGPKIRRGPSDAEAEAAARLKRTARDLEEAKREYEALTKEAGEAEAQPPF